MAGHCARAVDFAARSGQSDGPTDVRFYGSMKDSASVTEGAKEEGYGTFGHFWHDRDQRRGNKKAL
ncbi:hypothetical protein SDC9_98398 [bioreactor metagenome]|uniref:Uncharacterized protein n=1 Tax=bioreactor metagenome TaxID=1076179 RepID=A0A645AF49_9ZZZZ